jgi:hypothetical protein
MDFANYGTRILKGDHAETAGSLRLRGRIPPPQALRILKSWMDVRVRLYLEVDP